MTHTCITYQSMMFVDNAAEKPRTLKLISVAVHKASPPMTGTRERFTSSPERIGSKGEKRAKVPIKTYPFLAFICSSEWNILLCFYDTYQCIPLKSCGTWWQWKWVQSFLLFQQRKQPRFSGWQGPRPLLQTWGRIKKWHLRQNIFDHQSKPLHVLLQFNPYLYFLPLLCRVAFCCLGQRSAFSFFAKDNAVVWCYINYKNGFKNNSITSPVVEIMPCWQHLLGWMSGIYNLYSVKKTDLEITPMVSKDGTGEIRGWRLRLVTDITGLWNWRSTKLFSFNL